MKNPGTRCNRNPLKLQSCQKGSPFVTGLVGAVTEVLRVLGVGKEQYQRVISAPLTKPPVPLGDVQELVLRIRSDFDNNYFITGIIDDTIYDSNCYFADPTVNFYGLDLWKRNLQLIVPFLVEPEVVMTSVQRLGVSTSPERLSYACVGKLQTQWRLRTYLSLPWQPLVDILGATIYTLDPTNTRVVKHVERWNISSWEALGQIFRPSRRLQS
ncbi:MAG: hypothetical protein WDW36_003895 [Sanguina aurantia]